MGMMWGFIYWTKITQKKVGHKDIRCGNKTQFDQFLNMNFIANLLNSNMSYYVNMLNQSPP